jgi:hypothetical protein
MNRRFIVLMCIGLLVICLGTTVGIKSSRNRHPIAVKYEQIRLRMTRDEVETAIGMPPGDYDTSQHFGGLTSGPFGDYVKKRGIPPDGLPNAAGRRGAGDSEKLTVQRWTWDDYWIWVAFDERDRVVGCYLLETVDDKYPRHPDGLFDYLRVW